MYCQLDWPVCACIGTCLTKYAPKVLKKSCVLLNPPCSEPAITLRKRPNESFGFAVRGGTAFRTEKWKVLLENDLWCN